MSVTLSQLQAFVEAERSGTFSAAADRLGMSQPGMSDLIRRLEAELECELFHRGRRKLVLTVAGEQLLPHAQLSVSAAADGRAAVRALNRLDGGQAAFGLLRNASFYMGSELAAQFRADYPNVRIRLIGQNSAATAAAIVNSEVEAGLITLPVDDDQLEVLPVLRDEVVYVSASSDRIERARTIEQLCETDLVLYDSHFAASDPARRQLNDRAQIAGLRIEPAVDVEDLPTALDLVADQVGDSIVCAAAVKTQVMPRGLAVGHLEPRMYDTLAFAKRRGQVLSAATVEMVRIAFESLIEHQQSDPASHVQVLASDRDVIRFIASR